MTCGRVARGFTFLEAIVMLGIASLLGSLTLSWVRPRSELLQYRSAMQEAAGALRVMEFRAHNEHRTFVMRIDHASGRLQVLAEDRSPAPAIQLERTIWLPDGLVISQAPEEVAVAPGRPLPSILITVDAPAFQRMFQLTTTSTGVVQLHEDPSS